MYADI